MGTFRMTWLKVAFIAGAALALASCSHTPTASSKSTEVTTTTLPPDSLGLVPAAPRITDRVVLKTTKVKAGANIAGTLIVTNASQAPVDLTRRCEPDVAVVLHNRSVDQQPAFAAACGLRPLLLVPGENRFPISVSTAYDACQQAYGHSMTTMPACTNGEPPPLPAGTYHTVLYGSGDLGLPEPFPVQVTLTR